MRPDVAVGVGDVPGVQHRGGVPPHPRDPDQHAPVVGARSAGLAGVAVRRAYPDTGGVRVALTAGRLSGVEVVEGHLSDGSRLLPRLPRPDPPARRGLVEVPTEVAYHEDRRRWLLGHVRTVTITSTEMGACRGKIAQMDYRVPEKPDEGPPMGLGYGETPGVSYTGGLQLNKVVAYLFQSTDPKVPRRSSRKPDGAAVFSLV